MVLNLLRSMSKLDKPDKREQVHKACPRCRSQRRRCNDFRPCQRCVEAGLALECTETTEQARAIFQVEVSRVEPLVQDHIVDYCSELFFAQLYPTIPILDRHYVRLLRSDAANGDIEAMNVVGALCSQVLLQTNGSSREFRDAERTEREDRYAHGKTILQNMQDTYQDLYRPSLPTYRRCLLLFFIYACHASLSRHSQAYMTLREATTMFGMLKVETESLDTRSLIERLFWTLVASERSHAIRYRRPISLQANTRERLDETHDPNLQGFKSLVDLFYPINSAFLALLNQEITISDLSTPYLRNVDAAISRVLIDPDTLAETQTANLIVTQAWLRLMIWQLRLRERQLVETSDYESECLRFPVLLADSLVQSICNLRIESLQVHGVGLTEKLYDMASTLLDVEARIPLSPQENSCYLRECGISKTSGHLRVFITRLPGGSEIYSTLLTTHIEQVLKGSAPNR